ncbi:sigma-70 family RNA polymerase sigma factor [Mycolicibacterium mengxianglii]|uniref:sigma-70 family RNA polymerase sigma factor n=1 Tax=Mycolicibacterium mengxianglii TaxID=2736649 RepID=UPI0018EEF781|nr:sigma-70 family RNA polymerase sigma factor [Mycolicibacterium mengxianglii]
MSTDDWEMLPHRLYLDPSRHAEAQELMAAVRHATDTVLTDRQRTLFIAAVIGGAPPNVLALRFGMSRNAVYKSIFDSRRKILGFLVANDYVLKDTSWGGPS